MVRQRETDHTNFYLIMACHNNLIQEVYGQSWCLEMDILLIGDENIQENNYAPSDIRALRISLLLFNTPNR
jgi:hypothetical protein